MPPRHWALAGLVGFLALNLVMPVGAGGAMTALIAQSAGGAHEDKEARRAWRRLGIAIAVGDAIYAAIAVLMVAKPTF